MYIIRRSITLFPFLLFSPFFHDPSSARFSYHICYTFNMLVLEWCKLSNTDLHSYLFSVLS